MTARHNRVELRKADADIKTLLAANAELIETNEILNKELAEYKEKCQKLDKNLEAKEEKYAKGSKVCNCGHVEPSKNVSLGTGYICLNCGGECEGA